MLQAGSKVELHMQVSVSEKRGGWVMGGIGGGVGGVWVTA